MKKIENLCIGAVFWLAVASCNAAAATYYAKTGRNAAMALSVAAAMFCFGLFIVEKDTTT